MHYIALPVSQGKITDWQTFHDLLMPMVFGVEKRRDFGSLSLIRGASSPHSTDNVAGAEKRRIESKIVLTGRAGHERKGMSSYSRACRYQLRRLSVLNIQIFTGCVETSRAHRLGPCRRPSKDKH